MLCIIIIAAHLIALMLIDAIVYINFYLIVSALFVMQYTKVVLRKRKFLESLEFQRDVYGLTHRSLVNFIKNIDFVVFARVVKHH